MAKRLFRKKQLTSKGNYVLVTYLQKIGKKSVWKMIGFLIQWKLLSVTLASEKGMGQCQTPRNTDFFLSKQINQKILQLSLFSRSTSIFFQYIKNKNPILVDILPIFQPSKDHLIPNDPYPIKIDKKVISLRLSMSQAYSNFVLSLKIPDLT